MEQVDRTIEGEVTVDMKTYVIPVLCDESWFWCVHFRAKYPTVRIVLANQRRA